MQFPGLFPVYSYIVTAHDCVDSSVPEATTTNDVVDASCALVPPSCTTLVALVCTTAKGKVVGAATTTVNSTMALGILVALDMGVMLSSEFW